MNCILASLHVYALNSMIPNHKTVYFFTICYVRFTFQTTCQHIGQHFKELIQDFDGSCPVRKNWLVMQDYIPLSPRLCLSLNLFILFSSCLWKRFWHMFEQSPRNRCILHMINKTLTKKALNGFGSLRLIKKPIMMSNFPLRLLKWKALATKQLGEDFIVSHKSFPNPWNHSGFRKSLKIQKSHGNLLVERCGYPVVAIGDITDSTFLSAPKARGESHNTLAKIKQI